MADKAPVTKIYRLESIGYPELSKQLDNVAKKFEAIKKAKFSAEGKVLAAGDSEELKKHAAELANLIRKEKELDIQRKQMLNEQKAANIVRQETIRKAKEEASANKVVAGSYNDILRQQKQLYALVRNTPKGTAVSFQGQTLQFDQAIAKLKQLSAAEQDFRRQFAKDGLLVGEYASGIKMGLNGIGDVGNKITSSLSSGFKQLTGQLGQFVLGFIGAQAAMNAIQKSFTDTVRIDSLESALRSVSGSTAEFEINTDFLLKTTNRLGLELLDTSQAFKSFYASATQAGLSADQTRSIFEAAAEAGATLKLSQADINGVLLAFGQIASKGTVQSEELRGQIGERLPGAFAIAAKSIGVTQQQLGKMLENGQVLSNEFLPKFAVELKKTFGTDSSKNIEGLQASINRLKNRFTELLQANQSGLTSFFSLLINGAGVLIRLLPLVVVALALYTAEQVRAYVATQLTTKGTILFRLALLAQQAATLVANIALTAYYGTIALLTGGLTRATVATRIFSQVFKAFPLGAILTLVGLLAGAFVAFGRSVSGSTKALSENALKQMALRDATRLASDEIAKETGELNRWYKTATNANTSLKTRQDAIQKLIDKFPEYFGNLKKETATNEQLAEGYDKVTAAIKRRAFANAQAQLEAEAQAKVDEVQKIQLILEGEFANSEGLVRSIAGLTRTQRKLIEKAAGNDLKLSLTADGIVFDERDFAKLKERLELIKEERALVTKTFTELKDKDAPPDPDSGQLTLFERFDALVKSGGTDVEFDKLLKDVTKQRENANRLGAEYKKLSALEKKINDIINPKEKTTPRGSRLTGEQKDRQKEIDAARDEELARLNKSLVDRTDFIRREQDIIKVGEDGKIQLLRGRHAVAIRDEETFLLESLEINTNAINAKLSLLKGGNAEEKKQIAELRLEKIKIERDTNDKIFDIRSKALKDQFDIDIADARKTAEKVNADPIASPVDKAQTQLNLDNEILERTKKFNLDMEQLEKDRNFISKKNAEDRANELLAIERKINEDKRNILEADIKAAEDAASKAQNEARIRAADRTVEVLQTGKSPRKIAEDLVQIQKDLTRELQVNEVARLKILVEEYQKGVRDKLKTEQEFQEALAKYKEAEAKILEDNIERQLTALDRFKNALLSVVEAFKTGVLGIKTYAKDAAGEAEKHADAVQQSEATIKQAISEAYQQYFQNEQAKIDQQRDVQLERVDIEKKQMIAKAQSQQEIDSIEAQSEVKRKQIEKRAGEEKKKLALKELAINFAISIIKSIAQYGLPLALIPIAAATVLYGIQKAAINQQKFAKGGQVPTKTGGRITGPSHKKGGVPFEAEGEELMIINKRSAKDNRVRTITGTNKQIASKVNEFGGGVTFAAGAKVKKFESGGFIGQNLQAPVFSPGTSSIINNVGSGMNRDQFNQMMDRMENIAQAQSNRIDRIEVVQKTSTVTDAQRKQVKQTSVGTL